MEVSRVWARTARGGPARLAEEGDTHAPEGQAARLGHDARGGDVDDRRAAADGPPVDENAAAVLPELRSVGPGRVAEKNIPPSCEMS